jgi:hypothetical protein
VIAVDPRVIPPGFPGLWWMVTDLPLQAIPAAPSRETVWTSVSPPMKKLSGGPEAGQSLCDRVMSAPGQGYGQILREFRVSPKKKPGPALHDRSGSIAGNSHLNASRRFLVGRLGTGRRHRTLTRELCRRAEWVYAVEVDRRSYRGQHQNDRPPSQPHLDLGDALLAADLSGHKLREGPSPQPAGSRRESPLLHNFRTPLPVSDPQNALEPPGLCCSGGSRRADDRRKGVQGISGGYPCGASTGLRSRWKSAFPPRCFVPKPDVGSCVVTLSMRDSFPLSEAQKQFLDAISRSVFSRRRKTLANGLTDVISDKEAAVEALEGAGIDPAKRPEDLGVVVL